MKLKLITAGAAMSLLILTACGGGEPTAKSLKDVQPKTMNDSLSYYMGVSYSAMYQQMANNDTLLKGDKGRSEFLKGLNSSIEMLCGKSEAEIAGLMAGMQAAYQMNQLKKEMGVDLNRGIFATGFAYGVKNDTLARSQEVNNYLQTTMMKIEKEKMDKDRNGAVKKMEALAKQGFKKTGAALMEKTVKAGDGAQLKAGDRVKVTITAKGLDGKPIDKIPMPQEIVVGQTFGVDNPMTAAISKMKVGGQSQFAVAAADMMGGRQTQLGLDADAAIVFDVTIVEVLPAKESKGVQAVPQKVEVKPAPKSN